MFQWNVFLCTNLVRELLQFGIGRNPHGMFDIMFHVWTCFYIFAKVAQELHGLKHLDNYLDDFFLAEMSDIECSNNIV
jgi:hypothetical protein